MEQGFSQPRTVAKVTYVSGDRTTAILDLRNGQSVTYTSARSVDLKRGDVVFIDMDDGDVEPAPKELWPDETWIGTVRLLLSNEVVVDVGGNLKKVARPIGLDIHEGNTVEGLTPEGIIRILADKPVRYLDISTGDSVSAEYFRRKPDASLTFDHFGGYVHIVERAKELIELPLERHRELSKIGARPIKGVLLTGPPGTGKTMLARIIASRADAQFYEISGPQILSKWYGQSEELIREIFDDAAKRERAIVFFDEIDSLASQRNDTSHEASRRIVGQLLTAMDGFTSDSNVIVLATTNRIGDIDTALRRPGRFDWEINFPLPSRRDREAILVASARPLSVGPNLPHAIIADMTDSWSPAALAAIWSEAALLAVEDDREVILEEDYFGGYERMAARHSASVIEKRDDRGAENL
jgi:transitional endoplasmic reticulum ATPase